MLGCDISNSFVKVIGTGSDTSFWDEVWCGNEAFFLKYPRLHRLELHKNASVADRISWSDSRPSITWEWTSQPRWRAADDLENLEKLLNVIPPACGKPDTWTWKHEKHGKYSSASLAAVLTNAFLANKPLPEPTLLNKLIPQKIGIFMWRVQKNRLPVRIELDNKGIDLNSVLCPVCNDDIESINHALVACKSAASMWEKVRLWWGFDNLPITSYSDLALCPSPHIRDNLGSQIWQAVIWVNTVDEQIEGEGKIGFFEGLAKRGLISPFSGTIVSDGSSNVLT
ncbi:uncharacterized protein [Rutidosis leptorrhynchoides]|uniref:uncharacterized protein n=1 Tax=Rutidosis leptorrhynchoides TaxID=125765 RepID=UPI003A9A4FD5